MILPLNKNPGRGQGVYHLGRYVRRKEREPNGFGFFLIKKNGKKRNCIDEIK